MILGVPVLLLALLGGDAPEAKVEVLWEQVAGGVRTKGLLGEMSEEEFRRLALEFLGPEKVTVGQVVLYRSKQDEQKAAGKPGTDVSYESWLSLLKRWGTACPEVREALQIGPAIVERSVDRECRTKRVVLLGEKDPLLRRIDGAEVEILHIVFQPVERSENTWGRRLISLQFYVRTQADVSIDLARQLLVEMKQLSGMPEIIVVLRNDAWFIEDSLFPVIYPFDGPVKHIPTKEEYQTSQAVCGSSERGRIGCW